VKYREVIAILERHGFVLARHRGSHRRYKGVVNGKVMLVTIACHRESDDVLAETLASIIRQSGLPKALFRR
jgi:predicted RNA binding protein YcfA (HicA-like mRNA interferase family)